MEMRASHVRQPSVDESLNPKPISILESCIIKVLLYFDIFRYPLRSDELFRFLNISSATIQDVEHSLHRLSRDGLIHMHDEFFSLNEAGDDIIRRRAGNAKATAFKPLAYKRALLISKFPFVRAVMASGSISKDYMDDKSDLDFFIVTASNRLFIARTLLVMFKKIFLLNSHKYFCVNYFVVEDHLEIEEKNQFTATELATVLPLYNPEMYFALIGANPWLKEFFPNFKPRSIEKVHPHQKFLLKHMLETVINWIAIPVERFFFRLTFRRWKRIYAGNYSAEEFAVAFKTNPHASKNHPRSFQRKVAALHAQKITDFNNKHNVTLL